MNENMKEKYKDYLQIIKDYRGTSDPNEFELIFQITDACNFRCTYCYETKHEQSLSLNSMKEFLDKFFDVEKYADWWNGHIDEGIYKKSIVLHFFGGECTLEIIKMNLIADYFLEKCKENPKKFKKWSDKLSFIIETNGSLLHTKAVDAFFEKWSKYPIRLSISLDGVKEAHDNGRVFKDTNKPTFDLVYKNILEMIEKYPRITYVFKATLNSNGVKYYYQSYLLLKELAYKCSCEINLQPATGIEWGDDDHIILREQLKLVVDDILKTTYSPPLIGLYGKDEIEEIESSTYLTNLVRFPSPLGGINCGSCYSGKNEGIVMSINDEFYNCVQFAPLTSGTKDFCLGTLKTGITNHGLCKLKEIRESGYLGLLEYEDCQHCSIGVNCGKTCPAFSYKETGDINFFAKPNKNECLILKEFKMAGLKLAYYNERRKWNLIRDEYQK